MVNFTQKPKNSFPEFIEMYFTECRKKFPKIQAIAGKWNFEDLIPGLSDFDTRFICSDDMTDKDWCNMSTIVGDVHLDLCSRYPEWARIFEHLPGVNPTWNELMSDFSYYPEYHQWSFYQCTDADKLKKAEDVLAAHRWEVRDEYFFLKKFLTFYGPYNRGIDPPVNIGAYENKYPLHSRMMHYFTPPVQAAVSIIRKMPVRGKMEALRLAKEMFPELDIFDEIFSVLNKHYEIAELYMEPGLSLLEERLYSALKVVKERLKDHITLIPESDRDNMKGWKKSLEEVPIPPQLKVFDSSKFSRLFKGRLYFYANAPAHFDNIWLIQNELGRIGNMFYHIPYKIYWEIKYGEKIENPDVIIKKLVPDILTEEEANKTLEFSRLTSGIWEEGKEEETTAKIVNVFDDFFIGLGKIKKDMEACI